jgi:hypothetical protein
MDDLKGNGDNSSVSHTFDTQRPSPPNRRPRPMRYPLAPRRLRLVLLSLSIVLVLVVASLVAFAHWSQTSGKLAPVTTTALITIPTRTPTLAPTRTSTLAPTPTRTSTLIPTPTIPLTPSAVLTWARSGKPFIDDKLQFQNGNNWSENTNASGGCQFSNATYHASASHTDHYTHCLALAGQDSNLQNIAFQVQMTITKGDAGGLVFYSDAAGGNDYAFTVCITSACGPGYSLWIGQSMRYSRVTSGSTAYLKTAADQMNQLTVVARNGDIYLYVNDMNVALVHHNTFLAGYVGVTAYEKINGTDVLFSNAQAWKL